MQDALYAARIEAPVKVLAGALYVRVSAAVYNCRADYVALAGGVLALRW